MLRSINQRTGGGLWVVAFVLVFSAWWSLSFAQSNTAEDAQAQPSTESDSASVPQSSPAAENDEGLAAEDAEVDKVLKDAELIYQDDDDGDFIPSQAVSADQSIDYPIDI